MSDNFEINVYSFEEEYQKIVQDYVSPTPIIDNNAWGTNFAFKKFSLYNETPNSIASTNSMAVIVL